MTAAAPRRVFVVGDPDVKPYPLLNSLVVPRPIAWISTLSEDGVGNLAPHSFFTVACARPPIVQFTSVGKKDTLRNVRATGEATISIASRPLLDEVNGSSAPFDADVDEAGWVGVDDGAERAGGAPAGGGVAGVAGVHAALDRRAR